MVTIRIPSPPPGLFANLLGLAGLIAVVVAIGGLSHNWWWSLLAGGAAAVALSVIAVQNAAQSEPAENETTAEIPQIRARSRPA